VIRFKRAVNIPIGKLSDAVPDTSIPRRADPDGAGSACPLARKVTVTP